MLGKFDAFLRERLRRGQVLALFSRIPRCVVGLEAVRRASMR
jgi:hypothetical protein